MSIGQISLLALLEVGTQGSRLLPFRNSAILNTWFPKLLQKEMRKSGQWSRTRSNIRYLFSHPSGPKSNCKGGWEIKSSHIPKKRKRNWDLVNTSIFAAIILPPLVK